jgi:hypothetical protein
MISDGLGLAFAGADPAEKVAQKSREHLRRAVIASMSVGAEFGVFKRRYRVEDDAQAVLP